MAEPQKPTGKAGSTPAQSTAKKNGQPAAKKKSAARPAGKPTHAKKSPAASSEAKPPPDGKVKNTGTEGFAKQVEQVFTSATDAVSDVVSDAADAVSDAADVVLEGAEAFAEISDVTTAKKPALKETRLAHIAYLLYALTAITGVTFIAGLMLAYLGRRRNSARNTIVQSHYNWLIWTFWYGVVAFAVSALLVLVYIGWALLALTAVWMVWRLVKGWLSLYDGEAMASPKAAL